MAQRQGIKRGIFIAFLTMAVPLCGYAQKHDKQKYYQLRSMENGTWNFAPDWYYYVTHKSYSGAETYWKWQGLKSGIYVRFKETKASTKRCAVPRAAQVPIEVETINKLNHQIDSIQPILTEETIRSIERNVDVIYPLYKDDFESLGSSIKESLLYIAENDKGLLIKACEELQTEFDAICSQIEYIHQQGVGNEVETTKRQLVYQDAKERLSNLAESCFNLAYYASTL